MSVAGRWWLVVVKGLVLLFLDSMPAGVVVGVAGWNIMIDSWFVGGLVVPGVRHTVGS